MTGQYNKKGWPLAVCTVELEWRYSPAQPLFIDQPMDFEPQDPPVAAKLTKLLQDQFCHPLASPSL